MYNESVSADGGRTLHFQSLSQWPEDANYFGEWTGPRRMRYGDVTRVCFDGGYLRASSMTARKFR